MGRRRAMLYHLVLTVGMVKYENVLRVIIVKVEQHIKPLADPDFTPSNQDPLHALNVHPERMPTLLVPSRVKSVVLIPINRNPMLRNAFWCKKVSTNPAQQPK